MSVVEGVLMRMLFGGGGGNLYTKKHWIMYGEHVHSFNTASYEPRHEKMCNRGLRPGQTQNGLYSHRS